MFCSRPGAPTDPRPAGSPAPPETAAPKPAPARHACHRGLPHHHDSTIDTRRKKHLAPHVARIHPKNQPVETSKSCSNPVYGDRMRTPPRRHPRHQHPHPKAATTAGTLFLILATLSGCSATPAPTPSDTTTPVTEATAAPTETPPVFASNEEALAAATAAYAEYEALSDSITAEGGTRGDRIASAASSAYLPKLLDGFEGFAKKGLVSRGASTYDTPSLIRSSIEPHGGVVIELYLCSDISAVRLFDAAGVDVTPTQRTDRIPLQVGFISSAAEPSLLLVDKEDVWSGKNFCQLS
ncbi:hypothetical protein SAMN05216281_1661 [Cryobacterium luteum]|nr:hypothetical protein SAMN05216281_1661 [Cryobacterium luteum]